jgi:hypothetical protein
MRKTIVKRKDPSMKTRFFARAIGSLFLLALLTVLAAGTGFFPTSIAHAASACQTSPSDANCDGQDSVATGCGNDGVTLASVAVGTGTVAVRYSPTCKSAWAHTTNGTVVTLQATITRSPGSPSYSSSFVQATGVKSPLVYIGGHQQVQACGYVGNANGVGGTSRCTSWTTY